MISRREVSAASWGLWGSATAHQRYAQEIPPETFKKQRGGRRRCPAVIDRTKAWNDRAGRCGKRPTHLGMANGVCLMSGCEWHVRAWVRNGRP